MSSEQASIITANLATIQGKIEEAARASRRSPADVRLVAVTKYAELAWVRQLIDAGMTTLGESRPQQLVERAELLGDAVEWHLIGHLQRNKVRQVLPHVSLIHSIDTLRLLSRVGEIASELELRPRVLLEVNVSGETSKDGFSSESLRAEWQQIVEQNSVVVDGLMTMAPASDDPEDARPTFAALRELRDELSSLAPGLSLPELSMGMSGDYIVAIEEGATLVRIGSALFDGLSHSEQPS
ncbi:MAG: YggS family pyridoxal phosphate-dependent enzyme [Planctomycetaceae bacterium]|nr:YggS family pyridoxal phosphate-dependent enzyme [Planctomycetaceae bacterium]